MILDFWDLADETKMRAIYQIDRDLNSLQTMALDELKKVFIQYRFFTIFYVQDLALLTAKLPFGVLRSSLAEFLNEELGNGNANHAHPKLYDQFLTSLGVTEKELDSPAPECVAILQTIQNSLLENSWAYGVGLRGMGGECLCQIYLSSMYEHFIKNPLIAERAETLNWDFWKIHIGEIDIEHREKTKSAIADLLTEQPHYLDELKAGYLESKHAWDLFWKFIFKKAKHANFNDGKHNPSFDRREPRQLSGASLSYFG